MTFFKNIFEKKHEETKQDRAESMMRSKKIKQIEDEEFEKLRKIIEELKHANGKRANG